MNPFKENLWLDP